MAKNPIVPIHYVKHVWARYAENLLKGNPDLMGVNCNGIKNALIYSKRGMAKPRKVHVRYQSRLSGWTTTVYSAAGLVITYPEFRKVITTYFKLARAAIIEGEAVHIRSVGKICAKRVERDFRKKNQCPIDWHKTKQEELVWSEELGRLKYKKVHYFMNDDWLRIGWFKNNTEGFEGVYKFSPTSKSHKKLGFKAEFVQANNKDKLLKYRYLFQCIRNIQYVDVDIPEDKLSTQQQA